MYGKAQYYTIAGSPTPTEAPWKLGGEGTATVSPTVTPLVTAPVSIAETPAGTTPPQVIPPTTTPVPKKTTYSPLSPVTTLGALIGFCGLLFLVQRNTK
jgi:hypothetical protein